MNLEQSFGKELAGDLRNETAEKIRQARKEPENFNELQKQKKDTSEYNDPFLEERIEELKKSTFGRIFKTEDFRSKEAFLSEMLHSRKEQNIELIQNEYKKKFDEILQNSPLSPEEREKYLSTASMEGMNLDDYLTLMKRLSGEAFYHVTRYGVRENTFVSTGGGHTNKEGEFVDNLTPLLEDGNIKSSATTLLSNEELTQSLINKEYIQKQKNEGISTEEIVKNILSSYGSEYFLDRESTHFSYGKDLHHMYGGEDDYKCYVYYPVEYILQNDYYHATREANISIGQGYYNNQSGIDQQYNDFEIFNFGEGVPINAGILCITADIEVDPETGSQYKLVKGKPITDENGKYEKPDMTISSQEYWENYFTMHPELKPSKVLYRNLHTHASKENKELEEWANTSKIHAQSEEKKNEFFKYQKDTRQSLTEILTKIVEEVSE